MKSNWRKRAVFWIFSEASRRPMHISFRSRSSQMTLAHACVSFLISTQSSVFGDRSLGESDVDTGSTRSRVTRVTRPTENTSDKKAKKGEKRIGLRTDYTLEEVLIIPITRKGNVKEVDPFKPGRRLAQSLVGKIKMGHENEMDVDTPAELTNQTYLTLLYTQKKIRNT